MRGLIYIWLLRDFIYSTLVCDTLHEIFLSWGACVRKLIYFVDTIVYCFMLKVICLLKQYFENDIKCFYYPLQFKYLRKLIMEFSVTKNE